MAERDNNPNQQRNRAPEQTESLEGSLPDPTNVVSTPTEIAEQIRDQAGVNNMSVREAVAAANRQAQTQSTSVEASQEQTQSLNRADTVAPPATEPEQAAPRTLRDRFADVRARFSDYSGILPS